MISAQDLGRLNEIAGVFIRHGLGDAVRRMGLADTLAQAGHVLRWDHADELARLEPPVQVRRALEELGPTFVKLGQIMAGRADVFGPQWIAEFRKLHSRVPALPLEALRQQLREDLGGEPEDVFARFDPEPLAAASIAQVHRAQLRDGTEVILKIRRPGISAVVEADLRLLERLIPLVESRWPALKPYRPRLLVRQFAQALRRELDLASECRSAERIAANLSDMPEIVIPRVYWAWTGERLNVQDYIDGIPGEDLERVSRDGLDRAVLARRGAHAVLKMIIEHGFFHADPHPGNVVYLPGNRIAFIDFGMVGRVSPRRREDLLRLLLGLVERRPQTVAEVLIDWTGGQSTVQVATLEDEIEAFVDQHHGTALARLKLGQMLVDVTRILREHQLALPADLALLIKAFISLESMGRGLDPNFHMASEALPLLRQMIRVRYQPRVLVKRSWQTLRVAMEELGRLPSDLSQLLRRMRQGQVQVNIEIADLRRVGDQLDRAVSRLSLSLVVAALIIGSSIVMTVGGGPTLLGLPAFGLLGFLGAFAGGLWLLRSMWRSGHPRDDEEQGRGF